MPAVTIGQRIPFGRTWLLAQQWKKVFPVGKKSQSQTRRLFTALVHEVSYKIFPHKAEILRFYKIEMQCFNKRGFLRLSLTDFANILAINKTKETSLVKTLAWTRLHADKMI